MVGKGILWKRREYYGRKMYIMERVGYIMEGKGILWKGRVYYEKKVYIMQGKGILW